MICTLQPPSNGQLNGFIRLDGSKSISNRLLIIHALSKSGLQIENLSTSDDTRLLQTFLKEHSAEFNVHNAGTVARFLTAYLSIKPGEWQLHCADEMKRRPTGPLVDTLRSLGGDITYLENDGFLPIKINGRKLNGGEVSLDASKSSQYVTALMLIAPMLEKGLSIYLPGLVTSRPYITMTQRLMAEHGADIRFDADKSIFSIKPGDYVGESSIVESDWSAAAFYYGMVTGSEHAELELSNLFHPKTSTQGDAMISQAFQSLGVKTEYESTSICLKKSETIENDLRFDLLDIPDTFPALAAACALLNRKATFSNIENLAIKESNRLLAMQTELQKIGCELYEKSPQVWQMDKRSEKLNQSDFNSVVFDTHADHRIAMALSIFASRFSNIHINDAEVVSKSYPNYWKDLQKVGFVVSEHL